MISSSWAAEVRLSTPLALNTFECPRDEFCSYRVLDLCSKEKKTLQIALLSRIDCVLPRDVVFWIWGKFGLGKAWLNKKHPSWPYFTEGKLSSRASQPVDCVFMQDVQLHMATWESVCSYPADAHQSFTQDNYPGGTEVHESSCVVANQGPV